MEPRNPTPGASLYFPSAVPRPQPRPAVTPSPTPPPLPPSLAEGSGPVPVAVLGATGTVGARLVQRLRGHPWFVLAEAAASDRSAGERLGDRVAPDVALHPDDAALTLGALDAPLTSHLVLSALPADAARTIEPELAARGHLVVSNASAFRADPGVPLVVPEVNPDHLALLDTQRSRWPSGGGIVTNPNCAVAGLVTALAPLHTRFGVGRVVVTTLQAISGAGRPGPAAADLVDNVVPWIGGEEEKIAAEPRRILGRLVDGAVTPAEVTVSATATRVPVLHGHLESVSVELLTPATPEQARAAWAEFRGPAGTADLPTAPAVPVEVAMEVDRPQPRLDRGRGDGMTVVVGRIRPCEVFTLRFLVLSHNLERGAAGAALVNAELAAARGRVRRGLS